MYGIRIKELREEKGYTQNQLARLLHCKQNTVCRYENESNDLKTSVLIKLCEIFQVSADYILGLEDETGTKTYR